ncbi:hypothetical protein BT96DRAFT_766117, partial [Gymnopus androsaceus JB14]
DALRELKSRYNLHMPISKLPAEILCVIFMLVPESTDDDWYRFTVTHVCSHWRSIALNYPEMWNMPDFWMPEWACEMLKRSEMAPL